MDVTNTEIKQTPPLPTTPKETRPPSASWEDIRNKHLSSNYSDIFAAYLLRSRAWQAEPPIAVDQKEWRQAIDGQVTDARALLTTFQNPNVTMDEQGKIFAFGKERPPIGKDTLTRLYIGVDPRHATDAYKALLTSLDETGVLKDIDVALNIESLNEGKLRGNTIILYEPSSRPEVLDKVLAAYYDAKTSTPEAFALSARQKDSVMRFNFDTFKATVDANLAFAEIPAEDFGQSYDTGVVDQTKTAYNFPRDATDLQILNTMNKKGKNGVVLTNNTQQKFKEGTVKSGDTLHYKRRLSAPALVQMGTIIAN